MSRYHGIPDASVVSLLLFVCFTHTGLGENCIFPDHYLPTVDVSGIINELKEFLLLDYPVSLPSNLKSDEHCFELWQLHFISKELSRMLTKAGSELRKNIAKLEKQMNLEELFENCKLEVGCVEFERSNISEFLDSIHSNYRVAAKKMDSSLDFSNCTLIRCQSGSLSTPYPGYSAQLLENKQTSKSAILQRHHWLLIPILLLVCLFSIVKFSDRVPCQPSPLQV